jgi:hypothetical protein
MISLRGLAMLDASGGYRNAAFAGQRRRFEVPTVLVASSVRNFKSKAALAKLKLLVPLMLPKFVSEDAAAYYELRKRGTNARAQIG